MGYREELQVKLDMAEAHRSRLEQDLEKLRKVKAPERRKVWMHRVSIAAVLIIGFGTAWYITDLKHDVAAAVIAQAESAREQVSNLGDERSRLEGEVGTRTQELAGLQTKIQQHEHAIDLSRIEGEYERSVQQLQDLRLDIAEITDERQRLLDEITDERERFLNEITELRTERETNPLAASPTPTLRGARLRARLALCRSFQETHNPDRWSRGWGYSEGVITARRDWIQQESLDETDAVGTVYIIHYPERGMQRFVLRFTDTEFVTQRMSLAAQGFQVGQIVRTSWRRSGNDWRIFRITTTNR